MTKIVNSMLAAVTLALLAACAQEPPYFGPRDADHRTGYTDQQLSQNRYRITYAGNSSTPRETVENFLLLRSAEVAQGAGSQYFMFDMRDTKSRTTYLTDFEGFPSWFGGPRYGWYWHDWPYDQEAESRPITQYHAYAEIVLLTKEQAAKEPRALEAQSVIDHLGPTVAPPP
jgi:predicted small lipoprotein YifL